MNSSCSRRRVIGALVVCVVVIAAILIGLNAVSNGQGPRSFFVQEDPPGLDQANAWATTGRNGLEITAINALEDRWTPYFDKSIQDWENGDPDALTLSTRKVAHEVDCEPEDFRIKVCNGNYGATDWRGINVVFIRNGFVFNSAARLNDYHLDRESEAQKAYTMCHELGHAFGLPHTDVNYYNRDRGDCLDYTTRPRNNLSPGTFNFNLLADMYGTTDSSTTSSSTTSGPIGKPREGKREKDKEKENEDDRQRLRRLGAPVIPSGETAPAADILNKYKSTRLALDTMSCAELDEDGEYNTRLLHQHAMGEECEVALGDGWSMKVQKLLAQ